MKLSELQPYINAECVQLVFLDGYYEYFSYLRKNDEECEYICVEDNYVTNLFEDYKDLTIGEIDVDEDELVIRVLEDS